MHFVAESIYFLNLGPAEHKIYSIINWLGFSKKIKAFTITIPTLPLKFVFIDLKLFKDALF